MTTENDFLPFAVGSSANVLSQSAYAALTTLLQGGFQSGIAPSVQLNKVWRQSSIMSAVLAQFVCDRTGQNAIDDGTTATLLANLKLAAAALNGDQTQFFSVAPATQSQHAAQLAQLLSVTGPQCVLTYTNSTTLTLSRYRTGYVYSPGYGVVQVPSGGLTLTSSSLTASTLYYIYLNPNGGSATLVASTTTHQTDTTGVEVMSGNNAYVLVGMAYALTTSTWLSVARSWVHDRGVNLVAVLGTSSSTTSTTPTNVNTGLQISFLAWNNEVAQFTANASCSVNSANTNIETTIALNGSAISGAVASSTPSTTNTVSQTVTIGSQSVTEGLNNVNMFGSVGTGTVTGTWYAQQTSTCVVIPPRA